MFYLMMHQTHFIYGYIDLWLRTKQIKSEETDWCHYLFACLYPRFKHAIMGTHINSLVCLSMID